MTIEKGKKVSFDYTLTVDGEVVDTSDGKEPLEYVHGSGKLIPGLSRQLEGLEAGDEVKVTVAPQEGYGERNPTALKEFPKSSLPEGVEPQEGMGLQMRGPKGNVVPVTISQVKDESIVIDLNHPLAGKTLDFKVKVISVK